MIKEALFLKAGFRLGAGGGRYPPRLSPLFLLSRLPLSFLSLSHASFSLSLSFFPSSIFSSSISRPCSRGFHKTWWLMPSRRGSLQIATEWVFFFFGVLFCYSIFFFFLKLSSRITEPAGLLPAQQDKESRAWKMKAKPTGKKENMKKALERGRRLCLSHWGKKGTLPPNMLLPLSRWCHLPCETSTRQQDLDALSEINAWVSHLGNDACGHCT